ncbi:uncharacterized protein BX663DRAFT_488814 [Cokeromyces recurvatus]|uniref:uncharacterized protein n=1 Tax=Cokeromyces recurvatus TaxID=90255 RepID=UPI00221ED239|nr:uncharacterized protein BX663DRAFT_488814 [Cokeromyces recurvatus]KAI7899814.1 hypothetical protein BX663DRAFT_488814 [Cokeromyces recurvatus]
MPLVIFVCNLKYIIMVAIYTASIFTASILVAFSSYVNAYGQIAQVVDAENFCVFLPPNDSVNRNIADTEWNAQSFCIGDAPLAKNAGSLKSGFIQSAHYLATDQYVQVTGQIDPSKARLNMTDEGGQMDIKAPKGSSCAGWKYYVNLIEPSGRTYCMRCCNDDRTCNRGISEKGCAHIIPGDYSGPYGNNKSTTPNKPVTSDSSSRLTTTTTTTTTAKSTNTPSTTELKAATTPFNHAVASTPLTTINIENNEQTHSTTTSNNNNHIEMLGQNDQVTEQSFSGASHIKPFMMTFASVLIVGIAIMTK